MPILNTVPRRPKVLKSYVTNRSSVVMSVVTVGGFAGLLGMAVADAGWQGASVPLKILAVLFVSMFVLQIVGLFLPSKPLLALTEEGIGMLLTARGSMVFVPWSEVIAFKPMMASVGNLPSHGFVFARSARPKILTISSNMACRDTGAEDPGLTVCFHQMSTFGIPDSWVTEVSEIFEERRARGLVSAEAAGG